MNTRHYDVVVLGRSLGSLLVAALLARRQVRVLLVGQKQRPLVYQVEDHVMARKSLSFTAGNTPAFRRILQELAQSQRFQQMAKQPSIHYAYLDPERRLHRAAKAEEYRAELEREAPESRAAIEDFLRTISEANQTIDEIFDKTAVWPPGTLWERLETTPLEKKFPFNPLVENHVSLFRNFPDDSSLASLVELLTSFSSYLGSVDDMSELSIARLLGLWERGPLHLHRGLLDIDEFLLEKIRANGGICELDSSATALHLNRGRLVGIQLDGEDTLTGASSIVTDSTGESLAALSGGAGISRKAREEWPHLSSAGRRYVMTVVVNRHGLPTPLPRESFLTSPEPSLPSVHLQRFDGKIRSSGSPEGELETEQNDRTTLVAEVILQDESPFQLENAREALLETLTYYLPFLQEHLLALDSPYDGRPAWLWRENTAGRRQKIELERIHVGNWGGNIEEMEPLLQVEPLSYQGLAGEPLRGPIQGTYLVGPSVLPALGQEGLALAAWGVARILTQKDGSRQKLRRQLWRRIET
ncbi:MAG: hypothetical protein MK135_01915 [Polyangiaceae bacterium]|nr:hypothetical protein [Polyangiaceae bacterium]